VPERIVFTIASKNYASYALTLLESLAAVDPSTRRMLVLADTPSGLDHASIPAEVLPASSLGIPHFEDMATRYSVMELNTAIKPFVFLHLFDACPEASCIYLDPDILVLSPLEEIDNAIAAGAELVLTPHITEPLQDGFKPDDLTIMKSGIWNLGFAAMRCSPQTRMLVRWWADRCVADCRVDIPGNIFTDQRWMDLAPAFVERTAIIRHPGYNLAYWNLSHRPVESQDGQYHSNGKPLVFVHFSGVVPDAPEVFSKHQTRFRASDTGGLHGLLAHYQQRLIANGWRETSRLPYAWSHSNAGRRIIEAMRLHYREAFPRPPTPGELAEAGFEGCLAHWMDQTGLRADEAAEAPLTRLIWRCWRMRDDLRAAFDIRGPEGRRRMLDWFIQSGAGDFGADEQSIAAARRALEMPRHTAAAPRMAWTRQSSAGPSDAHQKPDAFFSEEIPAAFPEGTVVIPRQLALLWEIRKDLQLAFPMHAIAQLEDYLVWAASSGVAEGTVDAALFSAPGDFFERLPRTKAPHPWPCHPLVRAAARAYDGFLGDIDPEGAPANEEDAARIIAFMVCRWQLTSRLHGDEMAADVAWLNADPHPQHGEPPLPRLARLLHAWRADVQTMYSLDEPQGRLGLLGWYLLSGRYDHGLEKLPFPAAVTEWLTKAETQEESALPNVLRLVHAARVDLRSNIDLGTPAGAQALRAWFDASGRAECERLMSPVPPAETPVVTHRREALLLIGFAGSPTGRGEDARMTARALAACGADASLLNRGDDVPLDAPIDADIVISHMNAETALGDHVWMRRMGITARWHIGFWAWELSEFPDEWMHAFGAYDEIWASTEFARAAFARRSPKPVRLMPMAVELPPPPAGLDRLSFRLPRDRFLFFTSFDFRSFSARKNPEAAVRAFQIAFPRGDEAVGLVVKTINAEDDRDGAERLRTLALSDPRILLVDRTLGREEITGLIAACDAFISLHRSEGFGRGPAEAMLLGKPVVVTAYSGNLDFCREDNACLVTATLVPVREGEYPGGDGQVWADPDPSVAAHHMRKLVADPALATALGQRAAATIREQYGAAVVGRAYAERLREIGIANSAATCSSAGPDQGH
jgi:glycosyltransferase involved in cell wall biosynthesis